MSYENEKNDNFNDEFNNNCISYGCMQIEQAK